MKPPFLIIFAKKVKKMETLKEKCERLRSATDYKLNKNTLLIPVIERLALQINGSPLIAKTTCRLKLINHYNKMLYAIRI